MEKFADAIKVIVEKHLIPTILSCVLAALIYLITPSDFWIIVKISDTGYFFLIAGVFFLVIQLIVYLARVISNKIEEAKIDKKIERDDERIIMEQIWSFVDSLSDPEREILYTFMSNGNKAIEYKDGMYFPASKLFQSEKIHHRPTMSNGNAIHQFVLDNAFYTNLMYSQNKYGRICHFEDDKNQFHLDRQ